jgi:hypothetical protein
VLQFLSATNLYHNLDGRRRRGHWTLIFVTNNILGTGGPITVTNHGRRPSAQARSIESVRGPNLPSLIADGVSCGLDQDLATLDKFGEQADATGELFT